jgi:hypothetical protein
MTFLETWAKSSIGPTPQLDIARADCMARSGVVTLVISAGDLNGDLIMPMSRAEWQRRYRERCRDDLAHVTVDVRIAVRYQLDRLAWHYGRGLTELVEKLADAAERAIEVKLSGAALEAYRDASHEDTA